MWLKTVSCRHLATSELYMPYIWLSLPLAKQLTRFLSGLGLATSSFGGYFAINCTSFFPWAFKCKDNYWMPCSSAISVENVSWYPWFMLSEQFNSNFVLRIRRCWAHRKYICTRYLEQELHYKNLILTWSKKAVPVAIVHQVGVRFFAIHTTMYYNCNSNVPNPDSGFSELRELASR